jgi:hypothetical protein
MGPYQVTLKARFVEDLGADAQDHEELVSRMEKVGASPRLLKLTNYTHSF